MARTKRKSNPLLPETESGTKPARIYRAAGYARLSVEDSGKHGTDTIEGQKKLLSEYIERQLDMELTGLYYDNGRTGTDFSRPQFEKLMEAVKGGAIDCIVVKDLSRFGRNYKETGNYLERIFPFLDVRFIAVNDAFDTLIAERGDSGYIVPLKNLINEVYSKDISKKSGSALAVKQKNGDFIGAWAPYGYQKCTDNPHRLEPNAETAPIVRRIFDWRVDGMSIVQIARRLNDAGIPSPSRYLYLTGVVKTEKYAQTLWQQTVITALLSRQVYIGHMVQGRCRQSFTEGTDRIYLSPEEWKVVKNTHPPIVEESVFQAVQTLAADRKEAYRAKLGKFDHLTEREPILRGLIFCADCGRPLVRYKNVSQGKKLWYTYVCPTHANDPARCSRKNMREDELLPVLTDAIQKQTVLAADMEQFIRTLNASTAFLKTQAKAAQRLASARSALTRYHSLYDGLYASYVEKLITEQEYQTLRNKYRQEIEDAEQRICILEQEQQERCTCTPDNRFFLAFREFTDQTVLSRDMAAALIERITVDAENRVEIKFRYRDEYEALIRFMEGRNAK